MIDDPRGLERVINYDSRAQRSSPCKGFDDREADAYTARTHAETRETTMKGTP